MDLHKSRGINVQIFLRLSYSFRSQSPIFLVLWAQQDLNLHIYSPKEESPCPSMRYITPIYALAVGFEPTVLSTLVGLVDVTYSYFSSILGPFVLSVTQPFNKTRRYFCIPYYYGSLVPLFLCYFLNQPLTVVTIGSLYLQPTQPRTIPITKSIIFYFFKSTVQRYHFFLRIPNFLC